MTASTPVSTRVATLCACGEHDRPDVALARAMAHARAVSAMIRSAGGEVLDQRARGVAATVARGADDRVIWRDCYAGPLVGLAEALDRLIPASIGPVETSVIVGHDETGPITRTVVRDEPDARLVALRDEVRTLTAALDTVRDIVAADEAIVQMRRAIG